MLLLLARVGIPGVVLEFLGCAKKNVSVHLHLSLHTLISRNSQQIVLCVFSSGRCARTVHHQVRKGVDAVEDDRACNCPLSTLPTSTFTSLSFPDSSFFHFASLGGIEGLPAAAKGHMGLAVAERQSRLPFARALPRKH